METEWQSIETAPLNTKILLFDSNRVFSKIFVGEMVTANKGMEDEEIIPMCDGRYEFVKATHWMPYPNTPN